MENNFLCYFLLFHVLMPYNIILYFCLPYFHVSKSALFSTVYFSTFILCIRNLDTFYYSETCLQRPLNGIILCLLELIQVTKGHLDELQKAEIVSKSQLVPPVLIQTHY